MASPAVVMAPPSEFSSPQKPVVAQSVKLQDAASPPPKWLNLFMSVVFAFQAVVFLALAINIQQATVGGYVAAFEKRLAAPVILGTFFGVAVIHFMRQRPRQMVRACPPVACLLMLPVAVLFFFSGLEWIVLGVFVVLFALLELWRILATRKNFPYIDMMIHKSMKVIRVYIGHTVISMVGIVLSAGLLFSFINGINFAFGRGYDFLGLLLLVSMYWTINVVRFVVGGIVFGTASLYYYKGAMNMPSDPSAQMFGRISSTVFGHICIGAFLVPIVELLHFVLGFFDYHTPPSNAAITVLLKIIRSINRYGFVQVVHQKKGFRQGSQDAWDILILNNVERIVREDPARQCIFLVAVLGSGFVATLSGIIMAAGRRDLIGLMVLTSLYVGYSLAGVATIVFDAAVISYYVNYAEDPSVLARSQPALFTLLRERHHQYTHPSLSSQACTV